MGVFPVLAHTASSLPRVGICLTTSSVPVTPDLDLRLIPPTWSVDDQGGVTPEPRLPRGVRLCLPMGVKFWPRAQPRREAGPVPGSPQHSYSHQAQALITHCPSFLGTEPWVCSGVSSCQNKDFTVGQPKSSF